MAQAARARCHVTRDKSTAWHVLASQRDILSGITAPPKRNRASPRLELLEKKSWHVGSMSSALRHGRAAIGMRVSVRWTGDTWYTGQIVEYNPSTEMHLVKYEDGDQKSHNLSEEEEEESLKLLSSSSEDINWRKRKAPVEAPSSERGRRHRGAAGSAEEITHAPMEQEDDEEEVVEVEATEVAGHVSRDQQLAAAAADAVATANAKRAAAVAAREAAHAAAAAAEAQRRAADEEEFLVDGASKADARAEARRVALAASVARNVIKLACYELDAAADEIEAEEAGKRAEREAEEEGLMLVRADTTGGYRGVKRDRNCPTRPFNAQIGLNGHCKSLGYFSSAQEAALAYARAKRDYHGTVSTASSAAARPELRITKKQAASALASWGSDTVELEEEAEAQAKAEGLVLVRAAGQGGYKGVKKRNDHSRTKPYEAKIWLDGKTRSLGHFATPKEAALAYARAERHRADRKLAGNYPLGRQRETDAAATSAAAATAAATVAAATAAATVASAAFGASGCHGRCYDALPMSNIPALMQPPDPRTAAALKAHAAAAQAAAMQAQRAAAIALAAPRAGSSGIVLSGGAPSGSGGWAPLTASTLMMAPSMGCPVMGGPVMGGPELVMGDASALMGPPRMMAGGGPPMLMANSMMMAPSAQVEPIDDGYLVQRQEVVTAMAVGVEVAGVEVDAGSGGDSGQEVPAALAWEVASS